MAAVTLPAVTITQKRRAQQGSVLMVVLVTLAVSSLVLAETVLDHQQRLQQELERTHLAELHIVANSVFDQAGLVLESGIMEEANTSAGQNINNEGWPTQWQLPQGIKSSVELLTEHCPEHYPGQCYRIVLTLYGRGGTSLQRQQKYWAEPGCGSAWLTGSE